LILRFNLVKSQTKVSENRKVNANHRWKTNDDALISSIGGTASSPDFYWKMLMCMLFWANVIWLTLLAWIRWGLSAVYLSVVSMKHQISWHSISIDWIFSIQLFFYKFLIFSFNWLKLNWISVNIIKSQPNIWNKNLSYTLDQKVFYTSDFRARFRINLVHSRE
jgi:hypothetical protein